MPRKRKPPPPEARSTVADLVLAGVGREQIAEFLAAELAYKPAAAELEELIAGALEDLAAQAEHYREHANDLTVVRLNDLYTRAVKAQDIKTALDIVKAITRHVVTRRQADTPSEATPAPTPAPTSSTGRQPLRIFR